MARVYTLMTKVIVSALFVLLCGGGYSQTADTLLANGNHVPFSYQQGGYPAKAEDAGIEGTVIVAFEVDTLCRITNRRIAQGIGYGCDESALKRINDDFELALMRKNKFACHPGTMNIPVRFMIPD